MKVISVTEAHKRFGDLAVIRNGVTHWKQVETHEGTWVPMYGAPCADFLLTGYKLEGKS